MVQGIEPTLEQQFKESCIQGHRGRLKAETTKRRDLNAEIALDKMEDKDKMEDWDDWTRQGQDGRQGQWQDGRQSQRRRQDV